MPNKNPRQLMLLDLLQGWDWFENSLQNALRGCGFMSFNKSQAEMLTYISSGVTRPIEIAKKMRLSRQAIRHISNQLIDMDVLSIRDDPKDARSKILSFSNRAGKLRSTAAEALFALEALLRERVGARNFDSFKETLSRDWGSTSELVSDFVQKRTAAKKPRPRRKTSS